MTAHHSAEARAAVLLLAPGLLVITFLFLLPAGATFLLSLTDFDIYAFGDLGTVRFVGLGNYAQLLRDPLFWKALRNTLYLVVVGGPLTVAVALAAALLVEHPLARLRSFFRTIYFAPVVTTLVAVAVVWRYLYHPRYGLLNAVLGGGRHRADRLAGRPALGDAGDHPARRSGRTSATRCWSSSPGCRAIPRSSTRRRGSTAPARCSSFRHVTLPMLGPTFLFVGVITMIGYFQFFAEPYVMTRGGGPLNATLSLVLLMYKEGFRWWNMGYAAAIAFVLFLLILAATGLQMRWRGRSAE